MPHLEYFRSFVSLEDFIPEGCSLKKKPARYLPTAQEITP